MQREDGNAYPACELCGFAHNDIFCMFIVTRSPSDPTNQSEQSDCIALRGRVAAVAPSQRRSVAYLLEYDDTRSII